jgi:hypothetical protein
LLALGLEEERSMTPDEIRRFCESNYPQLTAEARSNPDGYSFFLGTPRRGPDSNRILRAVSQGSQGASQLKLAVSSRIEGVEKEFIFSDREAALTRLLDRELELFRNHFGKP